MAAFRLLFLANILGVAMAGWQFWKKNTAAGVAPDYAGQCTADFSKQCMEDGAACAKSCGMSYAMQALEKVRGKNKEGISRITLAIALAVSMLSVSCFVSSKILKLVLYFFFSVSFFSATIITTPVLKNWVLQQLLK